MAEAYISSIGVSEGTTKEWLKGSIYLLHKRGDQLACVNNIGITLLNVSQGIF